MSHVRVNGERVEVAVWRRYSDFDDVHLRIKARLPSFTPSLPEKRVFATLDDAFLHRRMDGLRTWLYALLQPEYFALPDIRPVRSCLSCWWSR